MKKLTTKKVAPVPFGVKARYPVKVTVVEKKPSKLDQYHSSRGMKRIVK